MITHNSVIASINGEIDIYSGALAYLADRKFQHEETRQRKLSDLIGAISGHARRTRRQDIELWAAKAALLILSSPDNIEAAIQNEIEKISKRELQLDQAADTKESRAPDQKALNTYSFEIRSRNGFEWTINGIGNSEAEAAIDAAQSASPELLEPLAPSQMIDGSYTYGGLHAAVKSVISLEESKSIRGGRGGWIVYVNTCALSHKDIRGRDLLWLSHAVANPKSGAAE